MFMFGTSSTRAIHVWAENLHHESDSLKHGKGLNVHTVSTCDYVWLPQGEYGEVVFAFFPFDSRINCRNI